MGVGGKFSAGAEAWLSGVGLVRDAVRQELVHRQLVAHLPEGGQLKVLDAGCGQGRLGGLRRPPLQEPLGDRARPRRRTRGGAGSPGRERRFSRCLVRRAALHRPRGPRAAGPRLQRAAGRPAAVHTVPAILRRRYTGGGDEEGRVADVHQVACSAPGACSRTGGRGPRLPGAVRTSGCSACGPPPRPR